ncbi:hypothetical protein LguiA_035864 [Lonicera macranthoides]
MHWITIAETEIMAPAETPKHQSLNQKLLFVFWCISSLFESLMKTCLGFSPSTLSNQSSKASKSASLLLSLSLLP